MKKVFILFLSLVLLLFSIVPASAQSYSLLPEPNPIRTGYYNTYNSVNYVTDSFNQYHIFSLSFPELKDPSGVACIWERRSDGAFNLNIYNYSDVSLTYIFYRYNALTGQVYSNNQYTVNSLSSRTVVSAIHFTQYTPYGITLNTSSYATAVPLCQIAWSDTTDPNTYVSWLQNIYTRQGNILQDLEIFYNAFDTFKQVNHYDLTQIYDLLSDIYDLLSEDSELSTAPVDDFSNAVEEYNSVEDQIMVDYKSDVDLQFQKSDQVFTGNNAFALISSTFTDLFVNGNIKINALILFTLCLGLGVLLIGRKLNA